MNREDWKGSITVFLSLSCILFLCLICTVAESARIQGAKAQTVNVTGIGTFSLLGEYERELLEAYDIFAVNGTYGRGSFQIEKADERFERFLSCNVEPENTVSGLCFDPWNLELTEARVAEYGLLTDNYGEAFYQQAVAYMKANAGAFAADQLMKYAENGENAEKWQKEYEEKREENDSRRRDLEKQARQQAEAAGEESSLPAEQTLPRENPLDTIEALKKRDILNLVAGDKDISAKAADLKALPSKSKRNKGNLRIEKKYSGAACDALFREYLMLHFPCFLSEKEGEELDYQIEYVIGGKASDRSNLKYVVTRLLAIREGLNYLYCVKDPEISLQADGLATALTGFLANPLLTAATKHGLLLALAYGESLIDVRTLLDGGKVPLLKDDSTWTLSVDQLGNVAGLLRSGGKNRDEGMTYQEYLRILLYAGLTSQQRMRGLDMIQAELNRRKETYGFKAENCIVAVRTKAEWKIRPVFFRVPRAFLGSAGGDITVTRESSISY